MYLAVIGEDWERKLAAGEVVGLDPDTQRALVVLGDAIERWWDRT